MTAMQLIAVDPEALESLRRELADLRKAIERVEMTPRPDWLTVADYAKMIGRSESTVMRKVKAGEVETKHVGGVRMVKV